MTLNILLRAPGHDIECYQVQRPRVGGHLQIEHLLSSSRRFKDVCEGDCECLRVVIEGEEHGCEGLVKIDDSCDCVRVEIRGRLLGGKGGFGTLLRGKGARGPKTSNFESSRDLQGRRLRITEAPAKMKQWVTRRVQEKAIIKAVGGEDKYIGKELSARDVVKKYKLRISKNSHNPFKEEDRDNELDQQAPFKEQMIQSAANIMSNTDVTQLVNQDNDEANKQNKYSAGDHLLDDYLNLPDDINVF